MSADFTASDLRRLADSLDDLAKMTSTTRVTVSAYTGSYLEANDHQIRIAWDQEKSLYTAEWPDST